MVCINISTTADELQETHLAAQKKAMKSFTHNIEDIGFNIVTLCNNDSRRANIYFHGYTAVTSTNDINILTQSLPCCNSQNTILIHWDSGNIKQSIFNALSDTAGNYTPDKSAEILKKLSSFAQKALKKTANTIIDDFSAREKNSDILANNLSSIIEKCDPLHQYQTINLIGHSLGARIILQGICNISKSIQCKIRNVILMGGAIGWKNEFTDKLSHTNNITIYNMYSKSDKILLAKPGFEHCIGRAEIPKTNNCVINNINCAGFNHTDYWLNFQTIINKYKIPII